MDLPAKHLSGQHEHGSIFDGLSVAIIVTQENREGADTTGSNSFRSDRRAA